MSRLDVEAIAKRWGCTPQEVAERITDALAAAGEISGHRAGKADEVELFPNDARLAQWRAESHRFLTVGITTDNRMAILDEDDRVVRWIDGLS